MSSLFLSYRRSDCPDTVKLLHERLKARLPRWQIFYDHQSIQPGEAFPERLLTAVTTAEVVFVIIGPQWLRLLQERRTLPVDHVHEEIKLALAANRRVIPVVVQNAAIPSDADLADFVALLALPSLNAKLLRPEPDFDTDLDKLIAFLEPLGPSIDVGTVLAGNYKLVSLIGEGGMGVVYMAQSLKPKRDVAVKLIKPGMDSKEVLARFGAERQALAVMNHPNIAKVLEAGATAAGRPFFVMELVRGVPITQYCDDKKLTPNDRLKLLRQVCDAVQHAHQKGIIHRDIKPTNVLVETVDGQPVPKVIDFGLAKALNYKLTDASGFVTQSNTFAGTLLYSSPEQAAGKVNDIDTRTDIYSLGALLYELLVGEPPFTEAELKDVGELAMTQRIIAKDPSKPSAKLSSSHSLPSIAANRQLDPAKLTRQVRGELDWIVMKALEKEPNRRYATATSLSEDIEHYLNHEPIAAGRPSTYSRMRKFVRRNRVPVIAGCVVFMALLLGIVGTTLGIFAAKEAEGRATVAADREKERADEALREKLRADDASQREKDRADEAIREKRRADAATIREKDRADEALREKQRAETQLTRAEKLVYANSIQTAQRHFSDGLINPAFDALNSCRWDFRGWEHDYLFTTFHRGFVSFLEHSKIVKSVSFSPDGKRIVSGCEDKTVKVWDAASGQEQLTLLGHTSGVTSVSFSPDGKRIVSGSYDKTVKVWDAASGQELLTLKGNKQGVEGVSFSPDGKWIVSGCADSTVKVWDATSGEELLTFKGHMHWVNSVSFSPDGKRIVSGSHDRTVKVWDLASGLEQLTLKGHTDSVTSVSFSSDGKRIVSGSRDSTVKVWDVANGQELLTLKGHMHWVTNVSFSPDGKRIASGSWDNTVKVWDAASGQGLLTLKGYKTGISSVSFSPDGKRIVSGGGDTFGWDGSVEVWDAVTGQEQLTLKGHTNNVSSVSFSPDGKRIASGGDDVRVWDAASGQELRTLMGHTSEVTSVSFDLSGKRIASGSWDKTVKVWDAVSGQEQLTLKGHTDSVMTVSFSPDGKNIVSGSLDRTVKVWDAASGQKQLTLNGHTEGVRSVSFSFDGKRIVSGGGDGFNRENTVKLWDAASGQELLTLKGHSSDINSVSFSPDGKQIVSGSNDKTIMVWDAASGQELRTLKGHINGVDSVSFSPDGKRIVSGGEDVRVWDAGTGHEKLILKGHGSVSFSPDGKRIVSSYDNTVKVWDASFCKERLTLEGHSSDVSSVSFSPDGKRIVSGSIDWTVKVWDAVSGQDLLTLKGHINGVTSVSYSLDGKLVYGQNEDGKIIAWNSTTGQLSDEKPKSMATTSLLTSPDGKSKIGIIDGKAYLERLDNRGPDGLTPKQRWDRERLAKWAAWNPTWHTQQADESEKAEQWFATAFHLRLLVKHAPNDAALAARLKAAEAKLNAPKSERAPTPPK